MISLEKDCVENQDEENEDKNIFKITPQQDFQS